MRDRNGLWQWIQRLSDAGPWAKGFRQFEKLEKANWTLPHTFQKGPQSSNILILAQWDLCWTSDLQNCRIIYLLLYMTEFVVFWYSSHWKLICYHTRGGCSCVCESLDTKNKGPRLRLVLPCVSSSQHEVCHRDRWCLANTGWMSEWVSPFLPLAPADPLWTSGLWGFLG